MSDEIPHSTAKVHPATREVLPDDPMEMHGFEVPGDPNLMLRLLVEEYARMGWGAEEILQRDVTRKLVEIEVVRCQPGDFADGR